jgi:hypothetical protein
MSYIGTGTVKLLGVSQSCPVELDPERERVIVRFGKTVVHYNADKSVLVLRSNRNLLRDREKIGGTSLHFIFPKNC